MDVMLGRDFDENRTVYFCYAERADGGGGRVAVARGRLQENGRTLRLVAVTSDLPPARSRLARLQHRLPHGAGERRQSVRHARRSFLRRGDGADARQSHRQDRAHPPGRQGAARQSVRRQSRARCRKSGPMACATRKVSPSIRPTENSGSRSTGRKAATRSTSSRRARTTAGRWSATASTTTARRSAPARAPMPGMQDAGLALDAVDRAVRHGVLHRRPVPRLEGQPDQRRAQIRIAVAARTQGRQSGQGGAPAARSCASASATCARGRTARSICSPTTTPAASCASRRRSNSPFVEHEKRAGRDQREAEALAQGQRILEIDGRERRKHRRT